MPTIDDVAKYAGVSHGTASKVINNVPGVSSKKIELVQKAIKALGYQPNIYARNLKLQKTQRISLILPTLQDKAMSDLYDSIYWAASAEGYSVDLRISHEIPGEETAILSEILSSKTDGVLLVTCQPKNEALFSLFSEKEIPLVFIQRSPARDGYDFIQMDIRDLLYRHISDRIDQGYSAIALITLSPEYSFEADCRSAYLKALMEKHRTLKNEYIVSTVQDSYTATLAALRLLRSATPPQVIYTTNALAASGVSYAIRMNDTVSNTKPLLFSLESSSWEQFSSSQKLLLSYTQMGLEAYSLLKDKIQQKTKQAPSVVTITPPSAPVAVPSVQASCTHKELRFLLKPLSPGSDSGLMLEACLNRLEKKLGIRIHVDYFDIDESNDVYYSTLLRNRQTGKYDLFTLDLPMLAPLEKEGLLLPLDDDPEIKELAYQYIPKKILDAYGIVNKKLMALPFSFTTQLLFYRKDLFNNSKLQRLYWEMFKEELLPPNTWEKYNQTAKFFTKSFHPESPTIYGSTFFSTEGMEILPRFWSLSKKRKRFTKETLDSPAFSETIRLLLELCSYVPDSNQFNSTWRSSQINAFRQGEIAMMPVFADWAYDLNYSPGSRLVGNLGYTLLPGKYSIQGGWSCGINPYSPNRDAALTALKWLCSEELLLPNAISGRFFPHKSLEKNADLYALFPWYKTMLEAFDYAIPRPFVESYGTSSVLPGTAFYKIIRIIRDCYENKLPFDATLAIVQKSLQ